MSPESRTRSGQVGAWRRRPSINALSGVTTAEPPLDGTEGPGRTESGPDRHPFQAEPPLGGECELCGLEAADERARPQSGSDRHSDVVAAVRDVSHLQPMLDKLEGLSPPEQPKATELVKQYADVFSASEFDLGCTPLMQHRIDTGNARPLKQGLRRHPLAHLDIIDTQVDKM